MKGARYAEQAWRTWFARQDLNERSSDADCRDAARLVVVAPHPDDEVLAAGGWLADRAMRGDASLVIALSDGTASHGRSALWPARRLASVRTGESRRALRALGMRPVARVRVGLPDGSLHARERSIERVLARHLRDGDLVVAPWRHDGHPDHEAAGRGTIRAARRCGARVLEAPIWAWHWRAPQDAAFPWSRACARALDAAALRRKEQALAAFRSQRRPSLGRDAILPRDVLAHFTRPFEVYFA